MKTSKQIRDDFIDFFRNKNHTLVPSSSVIPVEDPTLLFTNAGMNQFKDVFLGIGKRSYKRAVNSQKCIRVSGKHNDLEEVGHDTYHHTFFEMLGNWSFGDYYKKEAIRWAWELFTEIWQLPKDRLYATIFKDDDEAEKYWHNETDINPQRILRFDEKDNFWEMGETGPCGPSSEIHIDLGPDYCDKKEIVNHVCQINGECARFIELWNLVFIQYNRDDAKQLHPLPQKHIDTGMGFERVVAILQNVPSNYETDLFRPIIEKIEHISHTKYENVNPLQSMAHRVVADHLRMLTFAIADGALPSNEGRGYVLRRILRRAARFGRKLDLHEPFIYKLVPLVVDIMGEAFPEIKERQHHIREVIKAEEGNFNRTLDRGIEIFENLAEKIMQESSDIIPGKEAFKLYDTYGFPFDLTRIMAEEKGLLIDEEGFDREMEHQRERARKSGKFAVQFDHIDNWNVVKHCSTSSIFVGYEKLETTTDICKFVRRNGTIHLVLLETPFYAEAGGQVADKGKILLENSELKVIDVQKEGDDIIHICEGPQDLDIIHSKVIAKVDESLRIPTMMNHTSTHLLHEALRRVLGTHVQQAGSLVAPDRLRFDYTHFKKVEREELEEIERIVNQQIQLNKPLNITYTTYDEAREMGAMALFGEKYGEEVRVISVEDFSRELCGGTHVKYTGQIGAFIIVQDTAIASGVRRIEALSGAKAIQFDQNLRNVLNDISQTLNTPAEELPDKVKKLVEQIKESEKQLQKLQKKQLINDIETIIQKSHKIGIHHFAFQKYENVEVDSLKEVADYFRQKVKSGIILLASVFDQKVNLVCAVTENLIKKGFNAGNLITVVAKAMGGSGGGRPHLATAGAKNPEKLKEAVALLKKDLEKLKDIN